MTTGELTRYECPHTGQVWYLRVVEDCCQGAPSEITLLPGWSPRVKCAVCGQSRSRVFGAERD